MMRLADGFRLTSTAITSRPLRSLLTLLGVAIGIAAVTLLTAIGEGLRSYVLDSFSQFGTRIIAVHTGKTQTGGIGGRLGSVRPLTVADSEALRQLRHIEAVVPVIQGNADIKYQQLTRRSDVIGGGYQLAEAWRFKMALGSFLPQARDGRSAPYAVLGAKLHHELFGSTSPLGELIRIGDTRFRIIGVMAEKGQLLGFDLDEVAYIPVDWAESLFNREGLMEIDVVFNAGTTSAAMARRIKVLLQERHGVEDFTITTQDDMLSSLDRILGTLSIAIGALGGISLLVGGVGILTIMIIAVRERTSEIGLLRALGATRQQILRVFLGEAVILSALGGLMGLALGIGGAWLLHFLIPAMPVHTPVSYILMAEAMAVVIGLAAGVTPARRAAAMEPLEALRAE